MHRTWVVDIVSASLDGVDKLATDVETGVDGCLTLICGRVEFVVECARHDRNDWGKGDGGDG